MQCPRCGNAVEVHMTACPSCGQIFSAAHPSGDVYVRDPKNKKKALLWLILPWVTMIILLPVYAIVRFVIGQLSAATVGVDSTTGLATASSGHTVVNVISVLFGLGGLVALICIPIGIILGVMYLGRRDIAPGVSYDERSGRGSGSEVPPEVKKWNWGAVGLGTIWGAYHQAWLSLLSFVPILNIFWWIVMGIKGNEWAWQRQKWISVEDFHNRQKGWGIVGAIFFFLGLLQMLISFGIMMAGLSQLGNY